MQANQRSRSAKSTGPAAAKSRLLALSVAVGASILAIQSFMGHAVENKTLATPPVKGATLSALHSAIPADTDDRGSPPTF